MNRILKMGCPPGPDVMDLQDALNVLLAISRQWVGKPRLAVDGVYGRQTRLRVMEFQESRGLLADGIVTLVVWEKIRASLGKIPGLAIVRPLGGGGAGACVNVDPKVQEEAKSSGSLGESKSSELLETGTKMGSPGQGTRSMGSGLSSPQIMAWRSPLKGFDRASLCDSTSSGGDGDEKEEEAKKEQDDDDGEKKEA
jgi:hypothetical protein